MPKPTEDYLYKFDMRRAEKSRKTMRDRETMEYHANRLLVWPVCCFRRCRRQKYCGAPRRFSLWVDGKTKSMLADDMPPCLAIIWDQVRPYIIQPTYGQR